MVPVFIHVYVKFIIILYVKWTRISTYSNDNATFVGITKYVYEKQTEYYVSMLIRRLLPHLVACVKSDHLRRKVERDATLQRQREVANVMFLL